MVRKALSLRLGVLLFLLGFLASVAGAQVKTTVADTLHAPNGALVTGNMTIRAHVSFTAGDGTFVAQGVITNVTLSNGAFSVQLIPNENSNPTGTYYDIEYNTPTSRITETWIVPISALPLPLVSVRVANPSEPQTNPIPGGAIGDVQRKGNNGLFSSSCLNDDGAGNLNSSCTNNTFAGKVKTSVFANTSIATMIGTSPSVAGGNKFQTANSSPTTVSSFIGGVDSQQIDIFCGDDNTTIQNNAGVVTSNGQDFVCAVDATISFIYFASGGTPHWQQIGSKTPPAGVDNDYQKKNGPNFSAACTSDDGTTQTVSCFAGQRVSGVTANSSIVTITGATPSVSGGNVFKTNNAGSTTVTNFIGGVNSQVIQVICGDANTTIQNNANIVIAGGVDITCIANLSIEFIFDTTKWVQSGNSTGGGAAPLGNNGDLQMKNGVALAASGVNDSGSLVSVNRETSFKGPNPYYDVRSFGVRAVSSTPSTTGTINSGSSTLTLAAASTFVNGDGIVIRGAGANNTLATPGAPTVTASNARAMTGTGVVVTNTGGASTYQYQIVARTTGGGYTAASGVTSIANGPDTLGQNDVNISSWTASGQTITVNTSTNHNLVTNTMVMIQGAGNANGWWAVASTPTATSFTFNTMDDTALGADDAGGAAGSVRFWSCNHITWTEVPNAFEYFIYGRTAGAMNLIGISLPQSSSFGGAITGDPTTAEWDDFGPTMRANISGANVPDWVPLTPPGAAKNNDLVTTIVSGAGTTTLTLAATASNSVAGATTKFDNAPNIITAALATTNNKTDNRGVLYFPAQSATSFYVTNSVMSLGQFPRVLAVMQSGSISLGDTMILGQVQWSGHWPGVPNSQSTFQLWSFPVVSSSVAFPMIYTSKSAQKWDHISFAHTSPQAIILVDDELGAIPGLEIDHVNFSTAGNDYMSMHLLVRGDQNSGGNIKLTNVGGNGGGLPNSLGVTATPYYYFWGCGDPSIFESWSIARRGFFLGAVNGPGFGSASFNSIYIQGSVMPLVTSYINAGVLGSGIYFGSLVNDTGNMPTLAAFGSPALNTIIGPNGSVSMPTLSAGTGGRQVIHVGGSLDGAGGFFNSRNTVVDFAAGTAIDGIFGTTGTANYLETYRNASTAFGNRYQTFVISPPLPTPTCVVNTGGTISLGTYTFTIAAIYPNNGGSMLSPSSNSCVTTSGNQSITVSWTAVTGSIGYQVYENGVAFSCSGIQVSPGSNTTFTWNGSSPCNGPRPSIPGSGPSGMNAAMHWVPSLKMVATDGGGTSTLTAPSLTANRAHNLPDASGTFLLAPDYPGANKAGAIQPFHTLVGDTHGTVGAITDSGVQQMSVFDDMHHPNGTIQASNPNWTGTVGTINVTSNLANGGGGQSFATYTGVSWPSQDQTAIITLSGTGGAGSNVRVGVRIAGAGVQTGYLCSYANTGAVLNITRANAGTFTTMQAVTLPAILNTGDSIGINVTGTNISCYVNGKQVGATQSDASISSGTPGISFFGTGAANISSFAASYGAVSLGFAQTWSALQTMAGGINLSAQTASKDVCLDASKNVIASTACDAITRTISNASTAAGPLAGKVASGTATLGTGAIASGGCATVVTVAATNVATTDVITATFNADVSGVTGYGPSASGSLYIRSYPTANNVNFLVCNNTAGSITPGAATLNWSVMR